MMIRLRKNHPAISPFWRPMIKRSPKNYVVPPSLSRDNWIE